MKKLGILISGRGSNMIQIIKSTQSGVLEDWARAEIVISNKGDAAGILEAQKLGVATACIPSKGIERESFERGLIKKLDDFEVDLVVLAGFMRILSPQFVTHFHHRILNIHPADTDLHQGLQGYEWAFKNWRNETKVTVHYVDEGLDSGRVVAKESVDLKGVRSLEDVEARGLAVEHSLYSKAIQQVIARTSVASS